MREESLATWDAGNITWGGRVGVLGTVLMCVCAQEMAGVRDGFLVGKGVKHAQPENSNEMFQKLLKDLKELAEYKESLENSSNEIAALNSNQEKEGPPQDSDIRQLIREECCIEVCEEQKQNMENTILELVEICHQKELYCIHDNVDDLIESALNSKLLIINSQRLNKEKQEVKNVVEQPAECGNRNEIIKSGVEEPVPILSQNEVTLEDKKDCDMPICENSTICDDHSDIFSNSKNDDNILSDDDDFEDIKYVEASLLDPEIVSIEEENVVQHEEEEEEVNLEDISQIQDVYLCEKLLSITRLITNIESLKDNPNPNRVLNSSVSIPTFEESDNSLSDNFLPKFETFCDHTEETRSERYSEDSSNDPLLEETDLFLAFDNSIPPGIENFGNDSKGDIHFLEELLNDDSIPFLVNESPESDFDNPSFLRPPPEPPDAEFDFKPDYEKEIPVVMNDKDEFDDDYSSFMFDTKMFLSFLSTESEDTIFDPGISV
nr:hypothetical protein [Tanacetum cinerariifolium]